MKKNIQHLSLFLLVSLVSTSDMYGFNSQSYRGKYDKFTAQGVKDGELRALWEDHKMNVKKEEEAAGKAKRIPSKARVAALDEESYNRMVDGRPNREAEVRSELSEFELGVKHASGNNCNNSGRFAVDLEYGSMDKINPLQLLRACVKCKNSAMYKALAERAEVAGESITVQDVHGALMYEPLQVLSSAQDGGERADVEHSQVPLKETKHAGSAISMKFIRENNPELWDAYVASSLPQAFIDERMTDEDSMTGDNMDVVKAVYEGGANLDRPSLEKLKRYAEYHLREETGSSWWADEGRAQELRDFLGVITVKVEEMGADEEKKRKADWTKTFDSSEEDGVKAPSSKPRTRPKVEGEEAK